MKAEEYWSLLANKLEQGMKWERITNDSWTFIYVDLFTYSLFT